VTQYFPVFEPSSLRELKTFLAWGSLEILFWTKREHYRIAVLVLVFTEHVKQHSSSQNPTPTCGVSLGSPDGHHPGLRKGDIACNRTPTGEIDVLFLIALLFCHGQIIMRQQSFGQLGRIFCWLPLAIGTLRLQVKQGELRKLDSLRDEMQEIKDEADRMKREADREESRRRFDCIREGGVPLGDRCWK